VEKFQTLLKLNLGSSANLNLPLFYSKYNLPFVTNITGFLFLTTGSHIHESDLYYAYNIKKKQYSFPLLNELERFILRRYLKSSAAQNILNNDRRNKLSYLTSLENSIEDEEIKINFNQSKFPVNYYVGTFSSSLVSLLQNYIEDLDYNEKNDYSFFIRKIKFKPGYMTL
jgi:hypothetical protein